MKQPQSKLQDRNPQYKNDPQLAKLLDLFEESCLQMVASIRAFRKISNIPSPDEREERVVRGNDA